MTDKELIEQLQRENAALRLKLAGNADDRDMCRTCGHWREEHYSPSGAWRGEKIGCDEYQGTTAPLERRERKLEDLAAV